MADTEYRLDALRFDTGAVWLDLVATVGCAYGPAPVERLTGPRRLGDFLAHHDLTPARQVTVADVGRARELREVLRALGLAAVAGERLPVAAVRALDAVLAAAEPVRVRSGGWGALRLVPPANGQGALARVAAVAARDLSDPVIPLATCADTDCAMLFTDPGGRRRWCSTAVCGVRHRVREHRARRPR